MNKDKNHTSSKIRADIQMTVPETVMHDSRNQTGRNISASDETKSDVSEEAPDIKITAFYGKRMKKNGSITFSV